MEKLTDRQLECLRLSATMTDKEIARTLGISDNTVDKHMRAALLKLGVHSRKAALRKLASDPPYASDVLHPAAPAAQFEVVGAVSSGELRDSPASSVWRRGPYALLGMAETPSKTGEATVWLILRRAAIWLLIVGAAVTVMQAAFTFLDRFPRPAP